MPAQPRRQRHRHRFVAVCQQLLALGVICAALTPATGVMSLDLVPEAPVGKVDTGVGAGGVQLTGPAGTGGWTGHDRGLLRDLFGPAAPDSSWGRARG